MVEVEGIEPPSSPCKSEALPLDDTSIGAGVVYPNDPDCLGSKPVIIVVSCQRRLRFWIRLNARVLPLDHPAIFGGQAGN